MLYSAATEALSYLHGEVSPCFLEVVFENSGNDWKFEDNLALKVV